jgi:hypothetical protein
MAAQAIAEPRDVIEASLPEYGLDAALLANLRRLRVLPPPARVDSSAWRAAVEDALSIARDSWASSALALGWSAHDLFGIGPRDDWEFSGLAVWLRGRSVILLNDRRAIASDGNRHHAFERGGIGHGTQPSIAPVMLWEFGR